MNRDDGLGLAPEEPRPTAPRLPGAEECCGRGCDPCVYDRYFDALERYHEALKTWLERHPGAVLDPPSG